MRTPERVWSNSLLVESADSNVTAAIVRCITSVLHHIRISLFDSATQLLD